MSQSHPQTSAASAIIADLALSKRMDSLTPIAARFIYALRLIALHERAKRDPVPELAVRLGSVETAAKALDLSQAIASIWPENVQVSRFCCQMLTHDEITIGAIVEACAQCDRPKFEAAIVGLVRPARIHILWEASLRMVAAEARAV